MMIGSGSDSPNEAAFAVFIPYRLSSGIRRQASSAPSVWPRLNRVMGGSVIWSGIGGNLCQTPPTLSCWDG